MPFLIGERANSPARRPRRAISVRGTRYFVLMRRLRAFQDDSSRRKLARLGINVTAYSAMNLLLPDSQGVLWNRRLAAEVATEWICQFHEDTVYLAGGRVATAFGVTERPLKDVYGRRIRLRGTVLIVIPHPSGLNHFWNDADDVRRLRQKILKTKEK